jgi:hypothetical protein
VSDNGRFQGGQQALIALRDIKPSPSQPSPTPDDQLGQPLTIREVALMFGCSEWTVRQRLIRIGLPHFRLTPNGKLVFFHNQIVRWVLDRQRQKGGYIP